METHTFEIHGRKVSMRAGGVMARHYQQRRFYEPHMLAYIRGLGLRGRYVDIGANIGNHTVFFDLFCPSDLVDAFEPDDVPRQSLEINVAVNRMQKTRIHDVGLSDRAAKATNRVGTKTIVFEARTLDSYAFNDVTLVKIDIEGMEPACLKGAAETLTRCSPILFIEANTADAEAAQEAVLAPLGYARTGRKWNASPTFEWRQGRQNRYFRPAVLW